MIECSDDEESEEKMPPEEVDARLLQATKDGNIDLVKEYLTMGGNVSTTDPSGWNPILWASCNGNEEIVKLLITNGALNPYL
jgi:ankyrin repeat protein